MDTMDTRTRIANYHRLLTGINIFIGVVLIFFVLVLVRDVVKPGYKKIDKVLPARQADQGIKKKNIQEYESILKNNPFGIPAASLVPLSGSKEGAASRSDITLIGTVAGQKRNSFAIFSDSGGRQELYRIGEMIPGVGKLQSVDTDKVSIRGSGRVIDLPLADIVKITDVGPPEGGMRQSSFVRSVGEGTYIVDQKKVQQAIENPNQLMTDARLQPNFTDGKQEGYTLREVRNGGIYQSLGLQNGDVLLRINDYNISNPENALQAFTALRGMDRIQLNILRSGARMTLTYQIK